MNINYNQQLFPGKKAGTSDVHPSTVKWQQHNTKYEIHAATLDDIDVATLLTHCMDVKGKVDKEVSTNNHLGPSYFKGFPRTLSIPLTAVWDQVVAGLNDDAHTVANFDQAIQDFIACHATEQDRHDLVRQLLHPTKPRDLGVQAFYYRLLELNSAVPLLPGTDAPLTNEQLKQAFYDGMPVRWKDRFVNSGSQITQMATSEIVRYFRSQENQALVRQRENEDFQRRTTKKRKRKSTDVRTSHAKQEARDKSSSRQSKRSKGHISDEEPCPVHPGSNHNWGDCRANHFGRQNKKRSSDSDKSSKKDKRKPTT